MEREIARIASRSHGVATRAALLEVGVTPDEIKHRLGAGSLIRVHRGVYRVGHRAPSLEARYLAAVLACGADAALAGRAAGHLLRLLKGDPPPPEVIAPTERRVKGVKTIRARRAVEATRYRGVPVTTVPRTLVDLAAVLTLDALARACHEAGVLHRTTPAQVERVLAPNAPGAANLRAVIHGDVQVTLSKLEKAFVELLIAHGLPLPQMNRSVDGRRVDCHWPGHRLTIELDGYRFHNSRHVWEQDRRREREAHARGDRFRRYTYADVLEDPTLMLAELRELLA